LIFFIIVSLYYAVPGKITPGYVNDPVTGQKFLYRINGLRLFTMTLLIWIWCAFNELTTFDVFYRYRWHSLISTNVIGLGLSFFLHFRGDPHAPKQEQKNKPKRNPICGFLSDFWFGLEDNPHYNVWDLKMILYVLGGAGCCFNALSCIANQTTLRGGKLSWASFIYGYMIMWFFVEYLYHEKIHLYTYDFVAEKVGFKLAWGCIVFYTMFYPIGAWTIADKPDLEHPPALIFLACVCFVFGWIFSRGANNQKYLFKIKPKAVYMRSITPQAIGGKLLCNGFWGLSRHINYLGDTLMSIGIALMADYRSIAAWLYPIYYVLLFITRERDDDKRCREKYGDLWVEYCKRVPYRIIPYVY
jgi:protein-S-isoprenylcysteine O-methyltransferase Ste14